MNALYITFFGSKLYNLEDEESDTDIFIVFIPNFIDLVSPFRKIREGFFSLEDVNVFSFSIQKFFFLLSKSNPNCIEALFSNKVILDFKEREKVKEVVSKYFSPKRLFLAYISRAKSLIEEAKKKRQNKFLLNALRDILAARYVKEKKKIPPLEFEKLAFEDWMLKLKERKREKVKEGDIKRVENLIEESPEEEGNEMKLKEELENILLKIVRDRLA